jgi:asparagine synthase (glutamine-hydrolysing)
LNAVYSKIPGLKRYLNLTNSNYFGDIGKMSFDYERNIKEESYKQAFAFLKFDPTFREQLLTISMIDNGLHSLLWRNDRMGMMHSIESRFPFLTDEVMRFGINLPVKFKVGLSHRFHNWKHPFLMDKAIVRRLGEKLLPKQIARKKKDGFPMYGQMYLKVDKALFERGFWQESMQMSDAGIDYMVKAVEPYLLAKLASVEIWGRLFCWKNSIEEVNQLVLKHSRMQIN